MALPIQENLRALLQDTVKKPQLIIEIDGLPGFSSIPAQKYALYGDPIFYGDPGLVYGGLINDDTILPYIDLSKTTNQITQQMLVDKGGFSSITSFDVALVDKDQYITELITPGKTIEDILSRKARLYLALEGTAHPKDSVLFFSGIVAGVSAGAGYVNVNLASPEKLKNLEVFPKVSIELTANISNSATTISVVSTSDFLLPADSGTLRTYLLIGDEIIEYTGKTSTTFTGCVRGQFGTIAASHVTGDNVESAYRLVGNLRDLSLKLMLSGLNESYISDKGILSFNTYGLDTISNSIFVADYNIEQLYGVVVGDFITIIDAANAGNNGTFLVTAIGETDLGSYITVNTTLITEGTGAKFSLLSKYAVLPKFSGLEMTPDQVDVAQFEEIYNQFSSSFFEYDFFIKDSVNGNEFINTKVLYPSGCYALPRKAKTSVGLTIPPLAQTETKVIDDYVVTNASTLKLNRNISNNFYNAVVMKYDLDQVEQKFKRGKIRQSTDSTNRIKVANKPLTIEADGVRSETNFEGKFSIQSRRFLERYQFAAESIEVKVDFGTGFTIEIGDSVILKDLQLSDTKALNGSRNLRPRLFEVQNKVLNLKGQPINLTLVDTAFSLNGRYGVISPSSKVDSGSTTTTLNIKNSYGTNVTNRTENYKWRNLIGAKLRIRSLDYSYDHERDLVALNPADDSSILIDPALPTAPIEGYYVDIITYPTSSDPEYQDLLKALYVFFNNQLEVVSGISQTQFTVSNPALADIEVGYLVKIHTEDYTNFSVERTVTDITGNTITVNDSLGYVPVAGDKIELLGFPDGGSPYRFL